MPNADDLIVEFMNQKTKEALGEKVDTKKEVANDNFETTRERAKYYDTKSTNRDNEKALAAAKNMMRTLLLIPLFIGGIILLLYITINFIPMIIKMIKMLLGIKS